MYFTSRPNEGIGGLTKFSFYCGGWHSAEQPLRYQFSYRIGANNSILWYSGKESVSGWNFLPIGDPLDAFKVYMIFRIINVYGGYAELQDVFVYVSISKFLVIILINVWALIPKKHRIRGFQ